ncbi:Iron(III)-hydroxamate import system permease protein fhuB [Serratia rubidaea]|uniref:Iron(III)-hydroxamate import system permease protein fhuB n=1 Tax=Serratia rubidaea TaxID=61652 RepID=A0A4V6JI39_SERRU|nr:Iron(III)-hydroxamate import system permease protein fhuB [Serratia rubidaea]
MLGKNAAGWHWSVGAEFESLWPWRWPRVLSALAAGVMLAVAGTLIQKLTGNPMASPEVLGISSGAAFGVVVMMFIVPGDAFVWLLPAGSLGAALTLLVITVVAGRGGFLDRTDCCWRGLRSAPRLPPLSICCWPAATRAWAAC